MQHILLDTHILLWWLGDKPKLSNKARQLLADPQNLLFVSAASLWEIRIKQSLGKLEIPPDFDQVLRSQGWEELSISIAHTSALLKVPLLHQDPFDRILIAQALCEGLALLSADTGVISYGHPVLPA